MRRTRTAVAAVLWGVAIWFPCELSAEPIGLTLQKTVGLDPGTCASADAITVTAGTQVTYCYTATNISPFTLTHHDLVDDKLGVLLNNVSYTLYPGASTSLTETATINDTTLNVATWTAREEIIIITETAHTDDSGGGQGFSVTVFATDSCVVNVLEFPTETDSGPDGCTDGVDNDQDGTTDCGDVDCVGVGPCAAPAPVLGAGGLIAAGLVLLSVGASSLLLRRKR